MTKLEKRITAAYHLLVHEPDGGWVSLSRLHDQLGDEKSEIDVALLSMVKTGQIRLITEVNRRLLTDYDRQCALDFGGDAKHLFQIC